MNTVVVVNQKNAPGCFVQVLWFLFVGGWVGFFWVGLAWVAMVTIIGIPLSVKMINKLPKVFALRETDKALVIKQHDGLTVIDINGKTPQYNIFLRAFYFLLVGWWFTGIWIYLGYFLCMTLIGMPAGFWMFDKAPAVMSLRRSSSN
jgi:uncharacterized membrane protein YccF (DUF307 family)